MCANEDATVLAYTHKHTYAIPKYKHINSHTHTHTQNQTQPHPHPHTHTQTHTHTHTHAHTHAHARVIDSLTRGHCPTGSKDHRCPSVTSHDCDSCVRAGVGRGITQSLLWKHAHRRHAQTYTHKQRVMQSADKSHTL